MFATIQTVSITLAWICSLFLTLTICAKKPKPKPKPKPVVKKTPKPPSVHVPPTEDNIQVHLPPKKPPSKKEKRKEEPNMEDVEKKIKTKTTRTVSQEEKPTVQPEPAKVVENKLPEAVTDQTPGYEMLYVLDVTERGSEYSPAAHEQVLRYRMENREGDDTPLLDPRKVSYEGNIDAFCITDTKMLYKQMVGDLVEKPKPEKSDPPASVHYGAGEQKRKKLVFNETQCKLFEIAGDEEEEEGEDEESSKGKDKEQKQPQK